MDEKARENWKRWKAISDKIVSHKDYHYGHQNSFLLLKLVKFALDMMGHYNYLTYKKYRVLPKY